MNWRHSWDIFRKKIVKLWRRFSRRPMITYLKTLYYNEHSYASYLLDSVLDYIFNWLDRSLKYLGPLFVVVVLMMLLIYVAIAYTVGFAYWYDRSPMVLAVACVVGHWLLLNVSWNYYKSLTIDPGFPSDVSLSCQLFGRPTKIVFNLEKFHSKHCLALQKMFLTQATKNSSLLGVQEVSFW